jgi:HNH endonuclease
MPLRSYCSCGRITEPGCRRCDRCEAEHRSRKASSRHANRPPSPWQSPEWRALRNRLVKQAGNECSVCGRGVYCYTTAEGLERTDFLSVDHVLAIAMGGTNDEDNLRVVHQSYNSQRQAGRPARCYWQRENR